MRLRDVAARAGVSVKTVSNVVNGYVHVSEAMRARVQAALDELGYRPNLTARRLRSGRSGIIALALPSVEVPYFAELTGAVLRSAERHGVQVLVEPTEADRKREQEALTGLRTGLIDGVLHSPLALVPEDLEPAHRPIPVVLLGERFFGLGVDHVAVDNVAAAQEATEHLIAAGRSRIAFLGTQTHAGSRMVSLRLRGWVQAIEAAGLEPGPRQDTEGFSRHDGFTGMERLLDGGERVDAVFCANDLLALGALRALALRGVRAPEDVAVCGFDDSEEGRFSTPSLTSISPDMEAIAEHGVRRLLERIAGFDGPGEDIDVGHRLMVRESTVGRPDGG